MRTNHVKSFVQLVTSSFFAPAKISSFFLQHDVVLHFFRFSMSHPKIVGRRLLLFAEHSDMIYQFQSGSQNELHFFFFLIKTLIIKMKGKGEKNWLCYILKTSPGAYSEPKLYGINPVLSLRPGWIHQSCCFYCILPITRRAVSLFNLHISVVRCLASCYYCLQKVKKGKEIEMKRVRRHHSCEIITRYAFAECLRQTFAT